MPEFYEHFVNLVFIGIITLFPVVNPIGSALMVSPFFEGLSNAHKRIVVWKITLYAFLICTVSLFAGQYILRIFGISIPVVQLAGGIMICKMGWEFLSADDKDHQESETPELKDSAYSTIVNKIFYPITFPLSTGAGTISVIFTLSAHGAAMGSRDYYVNTGAILVSIVFICLLIYIFYLNTKKMIHYLGTKGENIVNRISAFLIFCVGLQIGLSGLKALFKI
ncbi:MAG: MarC family protein [Sphingobacteriales bacterium]|nr:MAG: MarC family protein [Sphingobacteriales bacterium]